MSTSDIGKRDVVLSAAQSVFLRYGYRRANMNDIAEGSGISRPSLYLLFRNKEEIFIGVVERWVETTIAEIETAMVHATTPEARLDHAFEIWSVRPFELILASSEARELLDSSFEFAQVALRTGYARFEATIVPVLAELAARRPGRDELPVERAAHVLASAVRGFKQTATTSREMRQLIHQLVLLSYDVVLATRAPCSHRCG